MLIIEDFDPIVSTFSKAGRVPFCDNGRMPSSYGCRPVCASRFVENGFLIGMFARGAGIVQLSSTGVVVEEDSMRYGCCYTIISFSNAYNSSIEDERRLEMGSDVVGE